MVLVLAIGAAVFFTAKGVHDHKKKKRALKAQRALKYGVAESISVVDDTTGHRALGSLPAYHNESLPAYHNEKLPEYHKE